MTGIIETRLPNSMKYSVWLERMTLDMLAMIRYLWYGFFSTRIYGIPWNGFPDAICIIQIIG